MSLKIYDKAQWHTEKEISEESVIAHFNFIFKWLKEFNLLSEEGVEILEIGIDSSISLNEDMVNLSGRRFLDRNYDEYISNIQYGVNENEEFLVELYYRL